MLEVVARGGERQTRRHSQCGFRSGTTDTAMCNHGFHVAFPRAFLFNLSSLFPLLCFPSLFSSFPSLFSFLFSIVSPFPPLFFTRRGRA